MDNKEEFGELNIDELEQIRYGEGLVPISDDLVDYDLSHNIPSKIIIFFGTYISIYTFVRVIFVLKETKIFSCKNCR